MSGFPSLKLSERWFRLLVKLYPPDFRDEMGNPIAEAYLDRAREAWQRRGRIGLLGVWIRATWDALRNGPGERLRPAVAWRRTGDGARDALRVFWSAPSFAAAAVLTLAMGIGVNIAVFTVMRSAILARLPVKNADSLVNVFSWSPKNGPHTDFSYPLYVDLRDSATELDGLVAYNSLGVGIAAGGQTDRVVTELVTSNYFSVLGVDLPLGPGLSGSDELKGAAPVAVIGARLWQTMFNGDSGVVGKTLQVNGLTATVVGVAPASFTGFTRGQRTDMWMSVSQFFTLRHSPDRLGVRDTSWLSLVGRTRPGVAVERAEAQLAGVQLAKVQEPGADEWTIRTSPARAGDTSLVDDLDRPLKLLMLVVGLILVIASANVANLLLTRAYTRQQEIAMRTALGASRARIFQQLLMEGAVLAAAGGTGGLFLGVWTASLFDIRTSGGAAALALRMEPDATVVGFTALISALAAVAIGILPALGASRTDLVTVLKGAGEAVSGAVGKRRVRTMLTIVQVAISLVLVVGAALFLRSLGKLRSIDPTLVTDRVVAAQINLTLRGYQEAQGQQFYSRLLEAVKGVPGVQAATLTSVLPVTNGGTRENLRAGATVPRVDAPVEFDLVFVSPGYFSTFGIPLTRGRDFSGADIASAPPVAIVNESMRRTFWGDGDPVGQMFSAGTPYAVVGVARDTKYRNLREAPRMVMYLPMTQNYRSAANLVVRTALPPAQLVEGLRAQVRSIDPAMPLYNVRTLAEHVDRSLYVDRLRATLIGALASLALALAAIGIYAVLSYTIAERTREVGVRLALGAQPGDVFRMLLGMSARVAGIGIAIGLALSAVLTRYISAQLYDLSPLDPPALGAASAMLFAVALAAAFVPAWRATRIDPVAALRRR
jgi:putative ABC transport system permease protein